MLTRKTVVLSKIETTYGVDPTPTVEQNAHLVSDVDIKVSGETVKRDYIKSSLSQAQFVRGIRQVELSFKTELKGTGTRGVVPPRGYNGTLFRACGMSEAVTAGTSIVYSPVSAAFESATIYVYKDGVFHKILGCRGSYKLNFEVGKYPVAEWTFKGLYAAPVDASPSAQTFSPVRPVPVLAAAFTIGGYAAVAKKVEIDLNATITERRSINAATGIVGFELTGREPQGSFDPEVVTEATGSFWSDWEAADALALNIGPIGTEEGNIVRVQAPKVQYRDMSYNDDSGLLRYQVPVALAMNAGDDELTITIT